jgi:hypothetical protein
MSAFGGKADMDGLQRPSGSSDGWVQLFIREITFDVAAQAAAAVT